MIKWWQRTQIKNLTKEVWKKEGFWIVAIKEKKKNLIQYILYKILKKKKNKIKNETTNKKK